jgi:hypothetical protein
MGTSIIASLILYKSYCIVRSAPSLVSARRLSEATKTSDLRGPLFHNEMLSNLKQVQETVL